MFNGETSELMRPTRQQMAEERKDDAANKEKLSMLAYERLKDNTENNDNNVKNEEEMKFSCCRSARGTC